MDTLKNFEANIAKIGAIQQKEFEEIKRDIARIEKNQITLNSNLEILRKKLDFIITVLEKSSR